jgi:hypothetical protein
MVLVNCVLPAAGVLLHDEPATVYCVTVASDATHTDPPKATGISPVEYDKAGTLLSVVNAGVEYATICDVLSMYKSPLLSKVLNKATLEEMELT